MRELRGIVERATPTDDVLDEVHEVHRASVENLAHFVALRSRDLRVLQDDLAALGLSSLGRSEAHVLATIDAVSTALRALEGSPAEHPTEPLTGFSTGPRLLARKAEALLGPEPTGRATRIMVTLPGEAAHQPELIERFAQVGMDVARINCAHDQEDTWRLLAAHVRTAAQRNGREIRILMDLAGPKLRTGPMVPGPAVIRLKPRRDLFGRVLAPARAFLVAIDDTAERAGQMPTIPVPRPFLDALRPGTTVRLRDARDSGRTLVVVDGPDALGAVMVETMRTTYLTEGLVLAGDHPVVPEGAIGPVPPTPGFVVLAIDDRVSLVGAGVPGEMLAPGWARVGCTLPAAVLALRPGHRVYFDDGTFGGVVEHLDVPDAGPAVASVVITQAPPGGGKLRAEKGINLPDTDVPVAALTAKDLVDLDTVIELADMVALSFVRHPDDVALLLTALGAAGDAHLGIVLKIETVQGFRALPDLLHIAMRRERVGVMIARGDLAVEAGYERLAEVQEEILWLCEAAHLPVIWATEVLDRLARTGRPSRSEITDAAMSERAECVMLNKGPHVVEAILTLDNILHRMSEHQHKKRPLLRPLRSWMQERGV